MKQANLILKNENGAALLTTLMLLTIVLLIGMAATDTTITELQIAYNEAAYRRGFYKADAGISYSRALPESDVTGKAKGALLPVPTGAPFVLTIYRELDKTTYTEARYAVRSTSIPSDYDAKVVLESEIQIPAAGRRPDSPGHLASY